MRRSKMPWLWIAATMLGSWFVGARPASAQDRYLQPGDVAVTCVDTTSTEDDRDLIQVTPLVPLPGVSAGRYQIQYTDNEANEDGAFPDMNENFFDIPFGSGSDAGDPTRYAATGLDNPDEQVFIFQGSLDEEGNLDGVLLWGFQMSSGGGWLAQPTDRVSALPTSIASASVAVTSNGAKAFAYTGPTVGTRIGLQAAIADPSNWTAGATCPNGFTVVDGTGGMGGGDGGTGGTAGDAGADMDSPDIGGADGDGPDVNGGLAGAPGTGGSGSGGVTGGGGISGTGGASGTGGVATLVGVGGATGTGGATTAMGTGGVDGGAGDGPGMGGAPGSAGVSGDAGVDGGRDLGDAQPRGEGVDVHDADLDTVAERPVATGCGCSAAVRGRDSLIGPSWLVLTLLLCRKRRRRAALAPFGQGQSDGQRGMSGRVTR